MAVPERPSGHPSGVQTAPEAALSEAFGAGTQVGRYRLVGKLATGGMGVVFRAYDPELSRHIALKLVLPSATDLDGLGAVEEYEQRLLREAQALARLSHPNVVAAFDVGRFAGGLFIAMELIDGVSLRAWLIEQRRPRAEVLHLLLEAGRGLSAAHRAGVVHRDFKLSNVMVSARGRVQVVDFGLARTRESVVNPEPRPLGGDVSGVNEWHSAAPASSPASGELTRTGTIVGTAGYIAPEQFDGATSDERSDQFSYASAAFTALAGFNAYPSESLGAYRAALSSGARAEWPPSVPRAIRKVIDRGLSRAPEQRYPSLDALLDDLERAARPPRRITFLVLAALGLSALAASLAIREGLARRCDVDDSSFDRVWAGERRARVERAFARSGNPRAADAFALVAARLDDYRARWHSQRHEVCLAAHVRREQSEQISSLRNACLDSQLARLGTLVGLFEQADAALVDRAPEALDSLAPLRECADVAALAGESERLPDAPARRAEIRALQQRWDAMQAELATGRWLELQAQAQALAKDAAAVGYEPIQARAMSESLLALERLGRQDEVQALRQRTLALASQAKVLDVVAQLAVRSLSVAVDGERFGEARALLPLVDADVRLAGRPPALQIRLLTAHAALLTADGQSQAAGDELELALAECRQLGPEGERSCLTPQRELGLLHAARRDFIAARRALEAAVELAKRVYGARHPSVLDEYENFAEVMLRAGELDSAARVLAESKALAASLPDSPQAASIPRLEGMLLQRRGELLAALPLLEQAERRSSEVHGEQTIQASVGKLVLGQCLTKLGRIDAALPRLERALELRRSLHAPRRSVAEASFALAEALWNRPGERRRSLDLGQQALGLYRDEGQTGADEAAQVQAWLDAHPLEPHARRRPDGR